MTVRAGRIPLKLWIVGIVLAIVFLIALVGIRQYYFINLKPVSNDHKTVILTIPRGATISQIGGLLQQHKLIRSSWAFVWYVHSEDLTNRLEAGTFALSPSSSLSQIAHTIASGHVAEGVVTILPGKRLDQIRDTLINDGFPPAKVDSALNPAQYADLPIISDKPANIDTLEGLLYPDTFDKTTSTDPSVIIRESLTEMGDHITPALQGAFASEGLTVYQAITLASIVEQEVSKPSDRSQAAQVFLTRLKQGVALGSDVTALYGAAKDGSAASLSHSSPYNTLQHPGLPPSPIGTISLSALNAVAHPAATNWLYFVTGDNHTTYFEQTLQQHNADTAKYCHKLCASP